VRLTNNYRYSLVLLSFLSFALSFGAMAQEHHAQYHDVYQGWVNQEGKDCCHGQDCGVMKKDDIDDTGDVLKIRIDGRWCPVSNWMTLKKGKSPDWSVVHACINHRIVDMAPCDRLMCFAGRPQM
jgi:hypothetical protein